MLACCKTAAARPAGAGYAYARAHDEVDLRKFPACVGGWRAASGSTNADNSAMSDLYDIIRSSNFAQSNPTNQPTYFTDIVKTKGAEILENVDFSAGDTAWTHNTSVIISGGVAEHYTGAAVTLAQPGVVTAGETYVVTFTIDAVSGGAVAPQFTGGSSTFLGNKSNPGTYSVQVTAGAGNTTLAFYQGPTGTFQISNVSMKKVLTTQPALYFDGSDDYFSISDYSVIWDDMSNMTVAVEYLPLESESAGNVAQLIRFDDERATNADGGLTHYGNTPSWRFFHDDAAGTIVDADSTTAPSIGDWVTIAGRTSGGSERAIYVNGTQEDTGTGAAPYNGSGALWLGRNESAGSYIKGYILSISAFNRALTDAEIAAISS